MERALAGKVDSEILVEAGLSIEGHTRVYDRFRNRIMLPLHDEMGKMVGFVGRALGADEPTYLNSPETAVYHKSKVLFGLHHAQKRIRKKGEVILVEGYFDQTALYRNEILHAVALGGVSFTDEHAFLLQPYAEHAYLCLDMDEAGIRKVFDAALKLSRAGLEVGVVSLPEGMDPDDYLKEHSGEEFLELVEQAQTPLEFKLGRLEYDVGEKKYRALKAVMPLLAATPDPIQRWIAVDSLEEKIGLPAHHIVHALDAYASRKKFQAADLPFLISATSWQECEVIEMYLRWRGLREVIRKKIPLDLFSNPLVKEIARWLYGNVKDNQAIADAADKAQNHQGELFEGYALSGLVRAVASEIQTDAEGLRKLLSRMMCSQRPQQQMGVREVQGLRDILLHHSLGKQIHGVQQRLFAAELRKHPEEVAALLDELIALTKDYK